jgi:hypothetical protein
MWVCCWLTWRHRRISTICQRTRPSAGLVSEALSYCQRIELVAPAPAALGGGGTDSQRPPAKLMAWRLVCPGCPGPLLRPL